MALDMLKYDVDTEVLSATVHSYVFHLDETRFPPQLKIGGYNTVWELTGAHLTGCPCYRSDAELMPQAVVLARKTAPSASKMDLMNQALLFERVVDDPRNPGAVMVLQMPGIVLWNEKGSMDSINFAKYVEHIIRFGNQDVFATLPEGQTLRMRFDIDACPAHLGQELLALKAKLETEFPSLKLNFKLGIPNGTAASQGLDVIGFRNLKGANGLAISTKKAWEIYLSSLRSEGQSGTPSTAMSDVTAVCVYADAIKRVLDRNTILLCLKAQGAPQFLRTSFQEMMGSQAFKEYTNLLSISPDILTPEQHATRQHTYPSDDYVPTDKELVAAAKEHVKALAERQLSTTSRAVTASTVWDSVGHTVTLADISSDPNNEVAQLVMRHHITILSVGRQQQAMYEAVRQAVVMDGPVRLTAAERREQELPSLLANHHARYFFSSDRMHRMLMPWEPKLVLDDIRAFHAGLNIAIPTANAAKNVLLRDISDKLTAYDATEVPDLDTVVPVHAAWQADGLEYSLRLDWTQCGYREEDEAHICDMHCDLPEVHWVNKPSPELVLCSPWADRLRTDARLRREERRAGRVAPARLDDVEMDPVEPMEIGMDSDDDADDDDDDDDDGDGGDANEVTYLHPVDLLANPVSVLASQPQPITIPNHPSWRLVGEASYTVYDEDELGE
jgi:hypothetical protein